MITLITLGDNCSLYHLESTKHLSSSTSSGSSSTSSWSCFSSPNSALTSAMLTSMLNPGVKVCLSAEKCVYIGGILLHKYSGPCKSVRIIEMCSYPVWLYRETTVSRPGHHFLGRPRKQEVQELFFYLSRFVLRPHQFGTQESEARRINSIGSSIFNQGNRLLFLHYYNYCY